MSVMGDAALYALTVRHFGDLGPEVVATMFKIAKAESSGSTGAYNGAGKDRSHGLWQINVHPEANPDLAGYDLTDPEQNAAAARIVYDRQGPTAWSTYYKVTGQSQPTESIVADAVAERNRIAAEMTEIARSGNLAPTYEDDGGGGTIERDSADMLRLKALATSFDALGEIAKSGEGGGLSEDTLAQIAQQDRVLSENMRQFDISEARQGREFAESLGFNREQLATTEAGAMERLQASIASEEKRAAAALAEQQRGNNLSATLDMLTNQIRVGELGVAEASNRISAATNAANVQRDILADHAGKALPAGTKTFPNLGAGGPIAAMARSLGQPFVPFETMGTFAIDPTAIARPISTAPGNSMLPGANDAVASAAAALAGMGVPMMAEGGPVAGPYISGEAGPELNLPMGNGQNYVMNMRQMAQNGMGGWQGMPAFSDQLQQRLQGVPGIPPEVIARVAAMLAGMGGQGPSTQPMPPFPGAPPYTVPPVWQPRQFQQQVQEQVMGRLPPGLMEGRLPRPPVSPGGDSMRRPQMGQQAAAQALAGI